MVCITQLLLEFALERDVDDVIAAAGTVEPFLRICEVGSVPLVAKFLELTHPDVNASDDKGNTALHLAVSSRHFDAARYLINTPSVNCDVVNRMGLSPLDCLYNVGIKDNDCVTADDLELACLLVRSGVNTAHSAVLPSGGLPVRLSQLALSLLSGVQSCRVLTCCLVPTHAVSCSAGVQLR